jgi:hypothetical protein
VLGTPAGKVWVIHIRKCGFRVSGCVGGVLLWDLLSCFALGWDNWILDQNTDSPGEGGGG